jgi:ABC-type amino acid transport substrate-binding protein
MHIRLRVLALLLLAVPCRGAEGEPATPPPGGPGVPERSVVVAVRESPPFAMRDDAGSWEGLSVALWQTVAESLGLDFRWQEMPLAETLEAVEAGRVDVAIVALTITPERERRLDFSHPYLVSGLTLAYRSADDSAWLDALRGFASWDFLRAVASLTLVLLAAAVAVWLFERKQNPEQFGGDALRGLGSGFWWSAVTMTTVGYGDKAPRTLGGRIVGLVWMFGSVIIIASFTAAIAASITVNRLGTDLLRGRALEDLSIGAVADSAAQEHAASRGLRVRAYPAIGDALRALQADQLDVVLHDEPILRYLQREQEDAAVDIAPRSLVRDDYGFGMPSGSPLREPINRALLTAIQQASWGDVRRRYLGAQDQPD